MELTIDEALKKGVEAHKAGKIQEADKFYTAILQAQSNHPDANHNMGVLAVGLGKQTQALPFFEKALEANASIDQYWLSYVDALVKLQKLDDAQIVIEKAKANGLSDELIKRLEGITSSQNIDSDGSPSQEEVDQLMALYNEGQLGAVVGQAQKLIEQYPHAFVIWNVLGAANNGLGRINEAVEAFQKATQLNPSNPDGHNNLGTALQDQGKLAEAMEALNKALSLKPDYTEAYYNMGNVLLGQGELEEAIEAYKKALSLKPDFVKAYYNMGNALQKQGKPEEAIEAYKKSLSLKPDYAEAYRNHSRLHTYTANDEYFVKMQALFLDSKIRDEERCHLSFALSKAFEDLNEVDQQFTHLEMGNKLRKKMLAYDIKQDIDLFSQLKKSYPSIDKAALQSAGEKTEPTPIFIIGMPRSGTTLVEQIVSSHSKVTGAGELGYVERLGHYIANGTIKPNAEIILDFRQRYIEELENRSENRSIVTDKMPHNFRYLGLIFSAFPDAIVIHVNREPAATCWSNYKHYFSTKELGYSYDLNDVVTYFDLYKDLMQFWDKYYGDRIYNLNYDNLTINQEDVTRMLIQYIGLEWEDCCLSPQTNKRTVSTSSQQQVRKKVYQGSSQQWRKFEPYLNGAFDKFEPKV
jgi:tetratricopeptide (TPR) repeat protein